MVKMTGIDIWSDRRERLNCLYVSGQMTENQPSNSPGYKLRNTGVLSPRAQSPNRLEALAEKQREFLLVEQTTEQLFKTHKAKFGQEIAAAQAALRDEKEKAQRAAEEFRMRQALELAFNSER
jgi:hypothetical protein